MMFFIKFEVSVCVIKIFTTKEKKKCLLDDHLILLAKKSIKGESVIENIFHSIL